MEQETSFVVYEGVVVPESALLKRQRSYGSIEGLPDEELADPDELERMVFKQEWGPVLALPRQHSKCGIRPNVDDDGRVDWGAFATVDFDRYRGEFDKVRYKADKLKKRLKDMVIMLSIMSERIPGRNKYKVLKLVRMGIVDIGDIADNEMYFLAEMYLRALRLRREIQKLEEFSRRRREQKAKAWLDSLG